MTTYSPAFERAVALTLKHEGGFQAIASDRGNWTSGQIGVGELRGTNRGISAMTYPAEDIRGMTEARARELYHRDYWRAVRGDELPAPIALCVFDYAVNSGPRRAIEHLQGALGVRADGVLGPLTLAAAQRIDPLVGARKLSRARILYLAALGGWKDWGRGWTDRTLEMLIAAVHLTP